MGDSTSREVLDSDLYDDDDEDSQKDKYLTFRIGDEDFGIEIAFVTEIVGIQKITEVPDMPLYVKGVINLRGRVIPVIDVRTRFSLPFREYDDRTCVIVVNLNETAIGLIVDTVNEVVTIPESQISPSPKVHGGASAQYLQGMGKIGDSVKILLDVKKLLVEEELEKIN